MNEKENKSPTVDIPAGGNPDLIVKLPAVPLGAVYPALQDMLDKKNAQIKSLRGSLETTLATLDMIVLIYARDKSPSHLGKEIIDLLGLKKVMNEKGDRLKPLVHALEKNLIDYVKRHVNNEKM